MFSDDTQADSLVVQFVVADQGSLIRNLNRGGSMAHMKRRRMIHPGLHANKKLCRVSIFARWLFTAIFTNADDEGFAGGDPMEWKLAAFPLDSLVTEEDRVVTGDELLAMLCNDGISEKLPDGTYRLNGLRHMIDTLTSRPVTNRYGYVPLLERRETQVGEPILYLPGWSEAQVVRKDIKINSTIRRSLRDNELTFPVTDRNDSLRHGAQVSKEVSKKKDKDFHKIESVDSDTTDVVSIAEHLRNESLRLTALALKNHFGQRFDPYAKSTFVGWAMIQKVVTAAKNENRNAPIFVGEIKAGSSGSIKDGRAYVSSVLQARLFPEPLEGANKPKFYTYGEWQDQIVDGITNGKGP